ncbi:MAG: sigma-70 family RNA polymerase sigma factor [Planctomycetes bacterium]|nr:sigma-70 family RNA polymerase sigma factor [Planctomycetota bacterium]
MNEGNVEEAIRRVREGSVDAYEIVIGACQGRLRAMISNVCPPGIDPDEIAHLAFVEAFRKIDQYTPNTRFFAWLATIARLLVLVELRKLRREARSRENYLGRVVGQVIEAELEAGSELDEQRVRALRGCVSALPDHLREVVQLRYDRDASIDNISRKVGKSSGAVKVQLFDIRRKLRECVNRKLALQRG